MIHYFNYILLQSYKKLHDLKIKIIHQIFKKSIALLIYLLIIIFSGTSLATEKPKENSTTEKTEEVKQERELGNFDNNAFEKSDNWALKDLTKYGMNLSDKDRKFIHHPEIITHLNKIWNEVAVLRHMPYTKIKESCRNIFSLQNK